MMRTDRVIMRQEIELGHLEFTEIYEYSERILKKLIERDTDELNRMHIEYSFYYEGNEYDSLEDLEAELAEDEEITEIKIYAKDFQYETHDILYQVLDIKRSV